MAIVWAVLVFLSTVLRSGWNDSRVDEQAGFQLFSPDNKKGLHDCSSIANSGDGWPSPEGTGSTYLGTAELELDVLNVLSILKNII